MAITGEKIGHDHHSAELEVVLGELFLGSSESVQLYWISVKGCHVRPIMSVYVSCVSGFSCRMHIDSNHHDSQI
jgi:hypothetical protein